MGRKNKIIVYNRTLFLVSETFVYEQACGLAKKFDVQLLSRKFENPHHYDLEDFKKYQINQPTSLFGRMFGKMIRTVFDAEMNLNVRSFFKIRKLFRDKEVKAIHAHFGPYALDILGYARAYKVPLVVTFHGHDASRLLRDEKYRSKLPSLFEYASGIIIVGKYMIKTLELEPWMDKVHLIPCSVDPEKFQIEKAENSGHKIKILHTGRVVSIKGVPDLIRVFSELARKHDNITLDIAGDGAELEYSKELAKELRMDDRINFHGRVSHKKVKELLNRADIFVLNSRTDDKGDMEGTPVTILEAMCLKKPVVSTIHAGIPDVIQHGKNGLLAHEYANEELKDCIEKLILNPELRTSVGNQARKTVLRSHTSTVIQEKINKIFEKIAEDNNG